MGLKIVFHRRKDQKHSNIIMGTIQNKIQEKKAGEKKGRPSMSCGTTQVAKQLRELLQKSRGGIH